MRLGEKLKQLRIERELTQRELAQKTGLGRGYLAQLETNVVAKPSADTFLKLARAFNIRPEELYQAAGYIKDTANTYPRQETPEDILERLRLASPVSIPVYTEFPVLAGEPTEPIDYIYRARTRGAPRNIEGYIVHGKCLEPKISDGDIIIVDREGQIDTSNIVACLFQDGLHLGQLRKIAGELWLESREGRLLLKDCQVVAPIIEVIKRLV